MNREITIIMVNKKVEGFKKPALIAESEDICPRIVEDLETTIVGIITETTTEIMTIGDGIIITVIGNKIEITRTTGTITLLLNNSNNNRIIITRLIIFRQIISNQK